MSESRRREIEPPELAALVDVAERPRSGDWSLRAALTRYAQPEPVRVSALLTEVRRLEAGLSAHGDALRRRGPEVWAAYRDAGASGVVASSTTDTDSEDPASRRLIGLLGAAAELDVVADRLADWAVDRRGDRPDAAVDAGTAALAARLDALGIEHEERLPPPSRRRG